MKYIYQPIAFQIFSMFHAVDLHSMLSISGVTLIIFMSARSAGALAIQKALEIRGFFVA